MTKEKFYHDYLKCQEDRILADRHWCELEEILNDYRIIKPYLETTGQAIVTTLLTCSSIHSINYRIKHEEHLLEKVIRRMKLNPSDIITCANYRSKITDLIGIRALHIFKEDWNGIHDFIIRGWEQAEKPTAYVRYGDSERILQFYKDRECNVLEHKYGYRSVHYQLFTSPNVETYQVEVQVRTLFEEAWGEIDHRVRYPYTMENERMLRLSSILNQLSGNADELASYMRFTKTRTEQQESEYQRELSDKDRIIEALNEQIDELVTDKSMRERLNKELDSLTPTRGKNMVHDQEQEFPWLDNLVDSKFFSGLQNQLNTFMNSPDFEPIELSTEDWKMLQNTQKELFKALGDPEKVQRLLTTNSYPVTDGEEEN